MRTPARFRLLVGMVLFLMLAPVHAAWAHAQLLSTDPADNAVLAAAPPVIQLRFNEPVAPLAIKLVSPDGSATDLTTGCTGGDSVSVVVPAGQATGTNVLSWRVVSADGHPIGGSLIFSVGQVTGTAMAIATGERSVAVALWASKALLFLAMFVGIGGSVFSAVALPPVGARRIAGGLSILGLPLAPITLGLQGLDALGLPLLSVFDGRAWSAGLSTSFAATALVAGLAFLVSLGALGARRDRRAATLALTAGTLAALSLALSGHASAAAPQWLTRPAVFLHIGGILFWVGALLPLWLLLRERSAASDLTLASFSRFIPFAVAPLGASGVVLAVIQMGAPGPQWVSAYGAILVAKLGLLIGLFALALWNRKWLTVRALGGEPAARRRLRRSIGIEMVIVVIILGLVAGWRFTPPPRALAPILSPAATAEPIMVHLMDSSTMAVVMVSPGSIGPVTLDIDLRDTEGMPITPEAVAITISAPELGIEPIKRGALQRDGSWHVEDLTIPIPGHWDIELDVRISRFLLVTLRGSLPLHVVDHPLRGEAS